MQPRNPVHPVTADKGELFHPDDVVADIDNLQGFKRFLGAIVIELRANQGVDLGDDLVMPREDAPECLDGPALQRFGQEGMIGVGYGGARDAKGSAKIQPVLIDEQPDKFSSSLPVMCMQQIDRPTVGCI